MKKEILLHEATDDVGVAVMDLKAGKEIGVVTLEGKDVKQIKLVSDVPLGHKVAMSDLAKGRHIIEYGYVIGYATAAIKKGEHIHIHNIKSLRWSASTSQVLAK